jgi:hypothetical protein
MKEPETHELNKSIGQLFSQSLKVSSPVGMLHMIREKINTRGYQSFDKEDILKELGHLQKIISQLHGEMLCIHDLLKQQS